MSRSEDKRLLLASIDDRIMELVQEKSNVLESRPNPNKFRRQYNSDTSRANYLQQNINHLRFKYRQIKEI